MAVDGSDRRVRLAGEELERLRLGYAQHVYRQHGATVERSLVLTGAWQTSRESAVQASRAREGTEWFLAREQLGEEGLDERRVEQLVARMQTSRAHTPSLQYRELPGPEHAREHHLIPQRAPRRAADPPERTPGRSR